MTYRPEKLRVVYLIDEEGTAVLRKVLMDKLFKYFLQRKETKIKPVLSTSQVRIVFPHAAPLPSLEDLDHSTLEIILSHVIKEVLRDDDKDIKKMRSIMKSYIKTVTLQMFLNEKEEKFRKIWGKKNKTQFSKLYPSTSANIENFDVTLLCFLLESFVKQPTSKQFSTLPNPNDIAEADDILRIRIHRNEIVHQDLRSDFSEIWKDLKDAIVRLGGEQFRTKIDHLQLETSLDKQTEEKYKHILKMWCYEEEERIQTVKSIKEKMDEDKSVVVQQINVAKETLSENIDAGNVQLINVVEKAEDNILENIHDVKGVMEKQQTETTSRIGKTLKQYQEQSEARLNSRMENYRQLLATWSQQMQRGETSGENMDNILRDLQNDINQDIAVNVRNMEENVARNLQSGMSDLCEKITKHSLTKNEFQKSLDNLKKRISDVWNGTVQYAQQRKDAEKAVMAELGIIKQKLDLKITEREKPDGKVAYAQQREGPEEAVMAELEIIKQKLDLKFTEREKPDGKDAVPDNVHIRKWIVFVFIIAVCPVVIAIFYLNPPYRQECVTKMDVIFLLDASTSVGVKVFEEAKDYISNIVSFLDVNKENIQVGLVTFSDKQHVEFHLSEHQSSLDVRKAVMNITYDSGKSTMIGEALTFVRTHSFIQSNGARLNADKTLILLTDGISMDKVESPANMLINDGVTIVCIGIGRYTGTELFLIASDKNLVFNVTSFSDLYTIKEKVVKEECTIKMG